MQTAHKLFLALSLTAATLAAQTPTITGVVNAASGIPPGLPNSGLALGSVFTVYGTNLGPAALQQASLPLPTTAGLAGTSVTIKVNGTTVQAPMIFTIASQIAGVVPSNTPTGNGSMTVTYNGKSVSWPLTIVQSTFGISNTVIANANNGPGVEQVAVISFGTKQTQVVTSTNTAAPGDTLIMWGTGLGATTAAGDTAGAPYGNIGVQPQVFVGGVASPSVTYWGRSPGSVGLDEIVFVVPQNAPLGCNVGIVVQTTNGTTPVVSNGPAIALAATDGATCTDSTQPFPPSVISALISKGGGKFMYFGIQQSNSVSVNASGAATSSIQSGAGANIAQITAAQVTAALPTLTSANAEPSFGSCYTAFANNQSNGPLNSTPLNAGASITLTPPSGKALTLTPQSVGVYQSAGGSTSLPGGIWSFSNGAGGPGVGPLTFNFPVPQPITWTNQAAMYSGQIDRTQPLTITWTGGDANGYVDIQATSAAQAIGGYQVVIECAAPTSAGQFTIPPSMLLAMGTGTSANARIQVSTYAMPYSLGTVPGFDLALDASQFQVQVPVVFK